MRGIGFWLATVLFSCVLCAGTPTARAEPTGLAVSPWPKFQHDAANTGRTDIVGPGRPAVRWRFELGGKVLAPPVIGPGDVVYVGNDQGRFCAIRSDGSLLWEYVHAGGTFNYAAAVGADGGVYVSLGAPADSDSVIAFNADGTVRWRCRVPAPDVPGHLTIDALGYACVAAGGGQVWGGCEEEGVPTRAAAVLGVGRLAECPTVHPAAFYAIDPSGVPKWGHTESAPYNGGPLFWAVRPDAVPAVAPDGTHYLAAADWPAGSCTADLVLAMNPAGEMLWGLGALRGGSCPVIGSSCAPVVGDDGSIHLTGQGPWGSTGGRTISPQGAIVGGFPGGPAPVALGRAGVLYSATYDGSLAAVDASGAVLWTTPIGPFSKNAPVVDGAGTIFVASLDGALRAVGPDGSIRWTWQAGGALDSQPAFGSDGTLYLGCNDGFLYALEEAQVLAAALDIRPGSCPNPLNPRSQGVLPVALVGTPDFAVSQVDVASLRLEGGVAPSWWQIADVSGPPRDRYACGCETPGPDGNADLLLKFDTAALAPGLASDPPGTRRELTLTGALRDGTPFEARDCVVLVGGHRGPRLAAGEGGRARVRTIVYELDGPTPVEIAVCDVMGRVVQRVAKGVQAAGEQRAEWNTDGVPNGLYFFRVRVGGMVESVRVVVLR
jgi:outer membrane protein assembly factor BamB